MSKMPEPAKNDSPNNPDEALIYAIFGIWIGGFVCGVLGVVIGIVGVVGGFITHPQGPETAIVAYGMTGTLVGALIGLIVGLLSGSRDHPGQR
ncbi:hypothetical protein ACLQ2P_39880 [Actinomadura citrea]|uniref:hypothetical protein n=2 Tax=Actinomadura TaxID=1988 RepID=UPI003CE5904E